jgi:hypothetical protein
MRGAIPPLAGRDERFPCPSTASPRPCWRGATSPTSPCSLWAGGASALLWTTLKELAASNRRFDLFVRELARFNHHHAGDEE